MAEVEYLGPLGQTELEPLAEQIANAKGIPVHIFKGLIEHESDWNPTARNPKSSATGLGQFLDKDAKSVGMKTGHGADDDRYNPRLSLEKSADYLLQKYEESGRDWRRAVKSYGEGNESYMSKVTNNIVKFFSPSEAQAGQQVEYLGPIEGKGKPQVEYLGPITSSQPPASEVGLGQAGKAADKPGISVQRRVYDLSLPLEPEKNMFTDLMPAAMAGAPEAAATQTPLGLGILTEKKPKSVMMDDATYETLSSQYPIFREEYLRAGQPEQKPVKDLWKQREAELWAAEPSYGDKIVSSLEKLADPKLVSALGGEAIAKREPELRAAEPESKKRRPPERVPTITAKPFDWQDRFDRTVVQTFRPLAEKMAGLVAATEDALDFPVEKVAGVRLDRPYSRMTKALVERALPQKFMPLPGQETIADLPATVAGAMLSYYTPGGAGASLIERFAHTLGAFASTDAARGYYQEGGEGAKKGIYHAVPTAVAFTLAGQLPGRPLQTVGVGTAFAGTAIAGGEHDPYKLTADFLTGVGLHWMGTRGEARKERLQEFVKNWQKENNVTEKEMGEVKQILSSPIYRTGPTIETAMREPTVEAPEPPAVEPKAEGMVTPAPEAKATPGEAEVVRPQFIFHDGDIGVVEVWDGETPIVRYTGDPNYIYKPKTAWRPATQTDFNKMKGRKYGIERRTTIGNYEKEFQKSEQAIPDIEGERPYPMNPQERRRAILEARIKRGESVPAQLLEEFPDLQPTPAPAKEVIEYSPAIQQGMKDWLENKAYLDNAGNFRIKDGGKIAPWNKEVKKAFPQSEGLSQAARKQFPEIEAELKKTKEAKAALLRPQGAEIPVTPKVYQDPQGWWIVEGSDIKHSSEKAAQKAADIIGRTQPQPTKMYGGGPVTADTIRTAAGAVAGARHFQHLQEKLAPETISPSALKTHEIIRGESGKTQRQQMQFESEIRESAKTANVKNLAKDATARMDFYDKVESGNTKQLETPELRGFARTWTMWSDRIWGELDKVTNGRVGYIENYWPHMWADAKKAQDYLRGINPVTGRPLPYIPSTRFLKERKFDLYSDAVKWGLEEKFSNPVDALLANMWEKNRFLTFNRVVGQLKNENLGKWAIEGGQPEGWVKGESPYLRHRIKIKGTEVYQHFYMPPDVARVLNNHLSGSAWDNPWYSTYRNLNDVGRHLQVALSLYHGSLVSLLDMSMKFGSDMRLAFARGLSGDLLGAGKALARLPKDVFAPSELVSYMIEGGKLREAYLRPGKTGVTSEMRGYADRFAVAGGRVNRDVLMSMGDSFSEAMRDKYGLGRTTRATQTVLRKASHWLMGEVVPRAQMSTFLRLAANETEMFKLREGRGPTADEQRSIDQGVVQHIQNLMGQLPSDNLAISRKMVDWLYPVVNFPGWNVGSVRWLAGMARGVGKALADIPLDQQSKLALETAAGMAAVYGIYGGITHYLLTGQVPQSFKNIRYPGKEGEEVQLPGYLRDLWGWRYHPLLTAKSKLATPLRLSAELLTNRDYMGNQVYDELAGAETQAAQMGKHIATGFLPFSLQSAFKAEDVPTRIASMGGATLAPRWMMDTPAEAAMRSAHRLSYARSPEEAKVASLKAKLRRQYDLGYKDRFEEGLKLAITEGIGGIKLSPKEARDLRKQLKAPKIDREFKSITSIDDMIRVYRLGNPEEKAHWSPILRKKINNLRDRDYEKYKKYRGLKDELKAEEPQNITGPKTYRPGDPEIYPGARP